ncbi:monovalent cation/H(+) antiporter subunit G [Halomonas campisalis]|uniref:Monovalent cation/H(+) antiporter subunit G n=1 Tax=Billgrantia campisalis TaxID=74661 RepID=A0ABS9P7D2_9GAMM|nr:monovalent cation/H(+) antiporter subunit G [Halomonas campisalis]MCG6657678.1 monovalent cation/H(+) antiporter subunit G [Halomonas campisalis]MDR5862550.1 monovalent cation/H(+) antiporter subunit G [Halomonas campisalis]
MSLLLNLLSGLMLVSGAILVVISGVGLLRFPDFYSRIQAAGMTDTLCMILILGGLMLRTDSLEVGAKLLFTLVFLFFTAPAASHALTKAARQCKLSPWRSDKEDESSQP